MPRPPNIAKKNIPGKSLGFDLLVVTLAGLAVVSGQMWPAFSRFDGEKGNSTGLTMSASLSFYPLLIALVPIVIGVVIRTVPRLLDKRQSLDERMKFGGPPSRSLPVAMAVGFFILPIASWWLGEPTVITVGFSALFILIMVRRLTVAPRGDVPTGAGTGLTFLYRFLYDRS